MRIPEMKCGYAGMLCVIFAFGILLPPIRNLEKDVLYGAISLRVLDINDSPAS